MQRRTFLLSVGAAATSLYVAQASAELTPNSPAQRPFSWRDADNRVSVNRLAISPDGARVALQVTRPLSAGGPFVGAWGNDFDSRGTLWLLDKDMGAPRRLTSGPWGVWSPSFSPDGRRLAALTLAAPGKVGLVVWELQTGRYRLLFDHNIEIYLAALRTATSAYAAAATYAAIPRRYLWLDATSLLFVDHGPVPQQFDMGFSSLPATLRGLRQRAELGKPSIRVWSDHSPTCGAEGRLIRVACDTGNAETLYSGDVRGVSVSPDGRSAALLVATDIVRPLPNVPAVPPLGWTAPGEPMVALKLVGVDITHRGRARDIEGVRSVGEVPPERLPLWSEDGTRIAVPVRTTYSNQPSTGNDAAWEVFLGTHDTRKWPAASYLDAGLLANLLTTHGLDRQSVLDHRPRAVQPRDYGKFVVSGWAWRCATDQVLFWQAPALTLIAPTRMTRVPGDFVSAQPPAVGGALARTLAVRADGNTSVITISAHRYRMENLATEPGWSSLGVRAGDGAVIYKDVADTGTFLMLVKPGERAHRSPLSFNTYFRHVSKPPRRVLAEKFPDGTLRSGVLQLPVGHTSGDRHPVIVYAYPDFKPSVDGPLTKLNSSYAAIYPIQYLLTKGFAFFHVPFQISGKTSHEPMNAAIDAVLPWLDVLDRQPEIIPADYGFWGHSNAGYVALALEALTRRFKAIVAWSTFPEIGLNTLHADSSNVALNCAGNLIQSSRYLYENPEQPYNPQSSPPWTSPAAFIRNDPLFNLNRASTPLLLVEGEFDMSPREMEEVYSILYGRGVPVELAYYWGEPHVFESPGNIHDSWGRTERFFRKYLRMR